MSNASDSPPSSSLSSMEGKVEAVPRVTVDWYRSFPWWRLLSQSVGISWRASHLILAALAVWVTVLGWRLGALAFAPEGIETLPFSMGLDSHASIYQRIQSALQFVANLPMLFDSITLRRTAYFAFGLLWTIGVWSFAGGLLARRNLMEMGIRSSVGWGPSCRLVCRRWRSMVSSICMPLVAIIGLAFFPLAIGVIARAGLIGQTVALILMIPSAILAIGIGWCAAISAFGFPLSICAIVAEKNADAFDGVSRSAAYIFQRPMTLMIILMLAIGLGELGDFVVRAVLNFGEQVLWAALSIGLGGDVQDRIGSDQPLLKNLLWVTQSIVSALRAAFLFSFFWSAAAAAYLTLRWEIDHTDFDSLDLQELGEPVPLPQFNKDSGEVVEAETGG